MASRRGPPAAPHPPQGLWPLPSLRVQALNPHRLRGTSRTGSLVCKSPFLAQVPVRAPSPPQPRDLRGFHKRARYTNLSDQEPFSETLLTAGSPRGSAPDPAPQSCPPLP